MEEFCTNSQKWILFMTTHSAPRSCPYHQEQFLHCEHCSYYQLKEPTNYLKNKLKKLSEAYNAG